MRGRGWQEPLDRNEEEVNYAFINAQDSKTVIHMVYDGGMKKGRGGRAMREPKDKQDKGTYVGWRDLGTSICVMIAGV